MVSAIVYPIALQIAVAARRPVHPVSESDDSRCTSLAVSEAEGIELKGLNKLLYGALVSLYNPALEQGSAFKTMEQLLPMLTPRLPHACTVVGPYSTEQKGSCILQSLTYHGDIYAEL